MLEETFTNLNLTVKKSKSRKLKADYASFIEDFNNLLASYFQMLQFFELLNNSMKIPEPADDGSTTFQVRKK